MLAALVLLNVMHPGFVLRGPDSGFPRMTRAEKKVNKAQKKEDKRRQRAAKKARKDGKYELERDYSQDSSSNGQRQLIV